MNGWRHVFIDPNDGQGESGSFTLESTLVLPAIMTIMLLVILFSVLVTDRGVAYFRASLAAERVAFNWSNSSKTNTTGAYPPGEYDGLYRRLFEDAALTRLFGIAGNGNGSVFVRFPSDNSDNEQDLPIKKLKLGTEKLKEGMSGEVRYRNELLWGEISVAANGASFYESIAKFKGNADIKSEVKAISVEPTEWIRSFDLIRYYSVKMKGSKDGEAPYRSKAATILGKLGGSR